MSRGRKLSFLRCCVRLARGRIQPHPWPLAVGDRGGAEMSCVRAGLLSTLCLTLCFSAVSATERITLRCAGNFASKETKFDQVESPNQSLIIDFDQGSVTGSLGTFQISNVSETSIEFRAESRNPKIQKITGGVDRVSGAGNVMAWIDNNHLAYFYDLNCTRAKPLF
jgi:hypothetical protein